MNSFMGSRSPVAFLSYVRDDDAHDFGGVTKFRERLEGEVKIQSGQRFEIFQDRNDIRWGQFWEERITESLSEVTFLIPIITPSFFVSPACRTEFETFLRMEQTLGLSKLILPIYYVSCDVIDGDDRGDPIVTAIKRRNWTDWRSHRFSAFENPDVRAALAELAKSIKTTMKELAAVAEAAQKPRAVVAKVDAPIEPIQSKSTVAVPKKLPSPPWSKEGNGASKPPKDHSYWAYTLEFDEAISAAKLMGDAVEAIQLQSLLSEKVAAIKRRHGKRIASSLKISGRVNGIAVTLLLENSGSLRGTPIAWTAAWVVILSAWFDVLGIKHEILGYTTRSWKGGQSREKWIADGKPSNPGRLCDLRHIIYKSFDEPASSVATNCAIMMRDGLLKENVDGEALLWAKARLENEAAKLKALFVLSDGAPVDDSTLSANPGDFLSKHLSAAAGWIEQEQKVDLLGIGLDYDTPYYSRSRDDKPENIGFPILEFFRNF
jgi:cobaltochelatase CobT